MRVPRHARSASTTVRQTRTLCSVASTGLNLRFQVALGQPTCTSVPRCCRDYVRLRYRASAALDVPPALSAGAVGASCASPVAPRRYITLRRSVSLVVTFDCSLSRCIGVLGLRQESIHLSRLQHFPNHTVCLVHHVTRPCAVAWSQCTASTTSRQRPKRTCQSWRTRTRVRSTEAWSTNEKSTVRFVPQHFTHSSALANI